MQRKGRHLKYLMEYASEYIDMIKLGWGTHRLCSEEVVKRKIQLYTDMGFEVFTEVGKKDPLEDAKLTIDYRIKQAKSDLDAGARKVIMEARESGKGIGVYDKEGKIKEDMVKKLVEGVGLRNIVFEAPEKSQQVYFILNLGHEVNLGNIKPEDAIPLETLRRGLRGDTLGRL
ncbi:MAG: phosphosulfolactate synthase [Candidatus Methanospirareceae archaeon]